MTRRTLVVMVTAVSAQDIGRSAEGLPHLAAHADQGWLYLATPTGDGWLLETWHEDAPVEPRQHVDLLSDIDSLAAEIARAVRAAADTEED